MLGVGFNTVFLYQVEEEKNLSSFLEMLRIYPLPKSEEAYCWEGSKEETGHDYWDRVERYEFPPSVNEEKISLDRVKRDDTNFPHL